MADVVEFVVRLQCVVEGLEVVKEFTYSASVTEMEVTRLLKRDRLRVLRSVLRRVEEYEEGREAERAQVNQLALDLKTLQTAMQITGVDDLKTLQTTMQITGVEEGEWLVAKKDLVYGVMLANHLSRERTDELMGKIVGSGLAVVGADTFGVMRSWLPKV
jgi:hypothetical protein